MKVHTFRLLYYYLLLLCYILLINYTVLYYDQLKVHTFRLLYYCILLCYIIIFYCVVLRPTPVHIIFYCVVLWYYDQLKCIPSAYYSIVFFPSACYFKLLLLYVYLPHIISLCSLHLANTMEGETLIWDTM